MATTVVLGGTKGIGNAIARRMSERGDSVWLTYSRDDAAARRCEADLAATGAHPKVVRCDIGEPEELRALASDVERESGRVDLLVNSAIYAIRGGLTDLEDDELSKAMAVNGLGTLWMVRAFAPLLAEGSTVVLISSRGSKVVVDGYGPVGCPKAMSEAAIRYLAVELGSRQIRFHVLSPSTLDTEALRAMVDDADERLRQSAARSPVGRSLAFGDVADAVEALASPGLRMMTGREIVLDGGAYLQA